MFSKTRRLVTGALAAATVGLCAASGASALTLPRVVDFWGMQPDGLAVRPAALGWTTDLGPSFNGSHGSNRGRGPMSKLKWSSWGARRATGRGDLWVPRESGVSISWKRYPASLRFSAPKTLSLVATLDGGTYNSSVVFSRVRVSFGHAVPAHWHRSASFVLKQFANGFYGFKFPG